MSALIKALFYSLNGLLLTWKGERAFRLEILACAIIIPLVLWSEGAKSDKLFVFFSLGVVLIAELLNTAVEKANDAHKQSPDPLIRFSKDAGSAAVLVALCLVGAALLNLWFF